MAQCVQVSWHKNQGETDAQRYGDENPMDQDFGIRQHGTSFAMHDAED